MQKVFCDACGEEFANYSFEPLIHIVDFMEDRSAGYIDNNFKLTSGRKEHFDLCASCYNAIHFEAYKVIQTIRETVKKNKVNE